MTKTYDCPIDGVPKRERRLAPRRDTPIPEIEHLFSGLHNVMENIDVYWNSYVRAMVVALGQLDHRLTAAEDGPLGLICIRYYIDQHGEPRGPVSDEQLQIVFEEAAERIAKRQGWETPQGVRDVGLQLCAYLLDPATDTQGETLGTLATKLRRLLS